MTALTPYFFPICCLISGAALVLAGKAMDDSADRAREAMAAQAPVPVLERGWVLRCLQALALCVVFLACLILAFGYAAN